MAAVVLATAASTSAALAAPYGRARLYPALAEETAGTAAEVARIVEQERNRVAANEAAGGPSLDEILSELETTQKRSGVPGTVPVTVPAPPPPPPIPPPRLLQQARLGYYQSSLEAAHVSIPTTQDIFLQYNTDYRISKDRRSELDLNNILHAGTLKSEDFLDGMYVFTPEDRVKARLREHYELQKNSLERSAADYDLSSSEATFDYNFPVKLRAMLRGYTENKAFDREGGFTFDSRSKTSEFYLERPFMSGTYSADLINEGQYFDSDPIANSLRHTLTLAARGPIARRWDAEASFIREALDRNTPASTLDYKDDLWIFLLDYRATAKLIVRAERDIEDKVFAVPDDIDFTYRRSVWKPSLTWLPNRWLTVVGDLTLESKRNFDPNPGDLINEHDEDYDTTLAGLTATYVRSKVFVTAMLVRGWHQHLLADNALQASYDSLEASSSATYNFSPSESLSLTYSRTADDYAAVAAANSSLSTLVTGDYTYRF